MVLDGVGDPVGQHRVLIRAALLLQVVGHPRRDGVTRHLLGPLAGVEDEREVRVLGPNRFEELDAVRVGHVVVGDDTVDAAFEHAVKPLVGVRRRVDGDPIVSPLEKGRDHLAETGFVVDVEDPDGGCGLVHAVYRFR